MHLIGLLAAVIADHFKREDLDLVVEGGAEEQELHGLLRVPPQRLDHAHRVRREPVQLHAQGSYHFCNATS